MATYKYQDNNSSIIFNNVTKPSYTTSGRIAKGTYTTDGNGYVTTKGYLTNAIDIDWNSAELPISNETINTTSELLEKLDNTCTKSEFEQHISDFEQQISDVKADIETLDEALSVSSESLFEDINNLNVYSKEESDLRYVSIDDYNELLERIDQLSTQIQAMQNNS